MKTLKEVLELGVAFIMIFLFVTALVMPFAIAVRYVTH